MRSLFGLERHRSPCIGIPYSGVNGLKTTGCAADIGFVDAAERREILSRYIDHQRRFEAAAARRSGTRGGQVIPFQAPLQELEQEPTDRKSTRLNSSHVAISYAVFCL